MNKNKAKCGCGRSPTGFCIGWHALSEEEYLKKKVIYDANASNKTKESSNLGDI